MFSLQPTSARLRTRLLRTPPLADVADDVELVAPGSVREYTRLVELPDEIDRIIGFEKPSARPEYLRFRSNGIIHAPPTVSRRYRRATLANGSIYANGAFEAMSAASGLDRVVSRGAQEQLSDRMLATSWVTEKYFGHWLTDGLALELLATQCGLGPLGVQRSAWTHEAGYRDRFAMTLHRAALAQVDNLWVVDDRHLNQGRIDRFRELRRRIRAGVNGADAAQPVFLLREGGAARNLMNQNALAEALARRGFKVVSPERESVTGLVEALGGAPLLITVEGSAMVHAFMCMPDNSAILAIQPPRRVTCIQKNNADWAGLRMGHTVADDHGDGFSLTEERLMRACDLLVASQDI